MRIKILMKPQKSPEQECNDVEFSMRTINDAFYVSTAVNFPGPLDVMRQ